MIMLMIKMMDIASGLVFFFFFFSNYDWLQQMCINEFA